MQQHNRFEIYGLGIFAGIVMALAVSGFSASATALSPGRSCTVSFSGSLASLQMTPAGAWGLTSSYCSVTGQSGGIMTGTFTGTLTSGVATSTVSGTWSVAGSTHKVTASSTDFTLSVSVDKSVDQLPGVGSAYQGVMSGSSGQLLMAVGTVGQVTIN